MIKRSNLKVHRKKIKTSDKTNFKDYVVVKNLIPFHLKIMQSYQFVVRIINQFDYCQQAFIYHIIIWLRLIGDSLKSTFMLDNLVSTWFNFFFDKLRVYAKNSFYSLQHIFINSRQRKARCESAKRDKNTRRMALSMISRCALNQHSSK